VDLMRYRVGFARGCHCDDNRISSGIKESRITERLYQDVALAVLFYTRR
jgi:hypothetical protein